MSDLPGQQDQGLGAFLLGGAAPTDTTHLGHAMLGAFAYATLPFDHPARPAFRADYLKGAARHSAIKAEVAPLLAAWRAAGIEALLWKGFYLAEFVYPTPGTRFHGDVDVLVRPADLRQAGRIAAELGWTGDPEPMNPPHAYRHYAYGLDRPGAATRLDVHRYVLHRPAPWTTRQKRITRAVWDRSIEIDWEGTTVRLPHPVDAALLCLLVHRAWGSDRWGLKPHDFLDLRYLIERKGVTEAALESRAAELGCRHTLAVMRERCDPWAGRFEPGVPKRAQSWRFDLRTLSEHAPFRLEQRCRTALRVPNVVYDTLCALPIVLRVRRAARRESDLSRLLADLTPAAPARRSGARPRWRRVAGVRWASRLVNDPRIGGCVLRSLAIYRALRQQGWPVEFVSGVRRDSDGVTGHAWVELDGRVLPELREWKNTMIYRVNFRYPGDVRPSTPPSTTLSRATRRARSAPPFRA